MVDNQRRFSIDRVRDRWQLAVDIAPVLADLYAAEIAERVFQVNKQEARGLAVRRISKIAIYWRAFGLTKFEGSQRRFRWHVSRRRFAGRCESRSLRRPPFAL